MKEFVNREKEKAFLEAEFQKDSASFVVIYGRRRIGKTSLIKEFIKDKNALFFLATEESEAENRNAFKAKVAEYIGNPLLAQAQIDSWEELFSYIINDDAHSRKLIIMDEFQYIGKANRAFVSVLQKIWDTMLADKNIMLILCGSLVNMMYSQTLSYDSPLYGRIIRSSSRISAKDNLSNATRSPEAYRSISRPLSRTPTSIPLLSGA